MVDTPLFEFRAAP